MNFWKQKIYLLPGVIALLFEQQALALFPNVCSVVKTPAFNSCMELNITPAMCGWPVPRPCAHFSYYVPVTFVESVANPKETFFGSLPGAAVQLGTMGSGLPFGAEGDQGAHSFHSHALTVPFINIPYRAMPCDDIPIERWCFEAMSEHVDSHWRTGSGDSLQPAFLAWMAAPKACLLYGAANSVAGEPGTPGGGAPICSFPNPLPKYPPSPRQVCNGWGIFFPRYGTYDGASQTAGALMIADRLKSLGSEVFMSVDSSADEKWQMISPTQSQCFRRGQNVAFLETAAMATDIGRLQSGKMKNYLFTVWKKVSCTKDLPYVASTIAAAGLMQVVCQGL